MITKAKFDNLTNGKDSKESYDYIMGMLHKGVDSTWYIGVIDEDQVESVNQEYLAYNYTHTIPLLDYCKLAMFTLDEEENILDYATENKLYVNGPTGIVEADLMDTIAYRIINQEKPSDDSLVNTEDIPNGCIELDGYKVMVYSFPYELTTSTRPKVGEFYTIRVIPTV